MLNIQTDSRKIKPGDTFVALKCELNDGHDYIEAAINNGASKIIAEHGEYSVETLIVPDTRKYLEEYLKETYKHEIEDMTIIGITGTNGKTTTSYIIYTLLNSLNVKCAYIGTIGYYLDKKIKSLPNTTLDLCEEYNLIIDAYNEGYKVVVLEASSQGLDRGRLNGISFDYAVFTNLTEDHLDYHKNMENYALAKTKLFKQLKSNGRGIVNIDDNYSNYYRTENDITYGMKESNYNIVQFNTDNQNTLINLNVNNEIIEIDSPLLGEHNVYNLVVAFIIAKEIGFNISDILEKIKYVSCPPGRMDTIKWNNNNIIIDYAHTPDAMEHIIKTSKQITKGKIITVFGCTGDREREKRPIMMNIALSLSDQVIVTIDDPHNEDPDLIVKDMLEGNTKNNYKIILDRGLAIKSGIEMLSNNDSLLVLGKGHEEFIIYKEEKIPFNDREEIYKIINK